jgi:hypothetical protein
MTTVPAPGFQVHMISFVTTLGHNPVRIKPGDNPIFFMLCAGMLHHFARFLPHDADSTVFERLMAFAKATGRPIIFVTTFLELQIADSRKRIEKNWKKGVVLNLQHWGHAAEGRAIVKEFEGMRWSAFAVQYAVVDQVSVFS